MSWLSEFIDKAVRSEAVDFLFVQVAQNTANPIIDEACYVSVRVTSLRLPYTRQKVVEKIYGVVHAFAHLDSRFGTPVEFAAATMPNKLSGVDPKNIQNVITVDKLVVGPTPWTGGDFNLQMGLFSVVSDNLAGPFLETMTKLTEVVGVGFAATAAPFIETIKFGVQALTRPGNDVKLEVGVDYTAHPPVAGSYVLVAAAKNGLAGKTLSLDPADGKLLVNGAAYTAKPYLVLSIEASAQRSDWASIPELKTSYGLINSAIRENDQDKATKALDEFRRLALTSQDLLPADGEVLVAKAEAVLTKVFGSAARSKAIAETPEFEALGLYA